MSTTHSMSRCRGSKDPVCQPLPCCSPEAVLRVLGRLDAELEVRVGDGRPVRLRCVPAVSPWPEERVGAASVDLEVALGPEATSRVFEDDGVLLLLLLASDAEVDVALGDALILRLRLATPEAALHHLGSLDASLVKTSEDREPVSVGIGTVPTPEPADDEKFLIRRERRRRRQIALSPEAASFMLDPRDRLQAGITVPSSLACLLLCLGLRVRVQLAIRFCLQLDLRPCLCRRRGPRHHLRLDLLLLHGADRGLPQVLGHSPGPLDAGVDEALAYRSPVYLRLRTLTTPGPLHESL
mmetsp:Transcript_105489/g.298111  ORF Transcript_105489/g.298111 Transcript_105489/m.298111 type:complete len:297 (+) Transcript_105489:49-939(+)